jgi:anti-sigma regulatory factor (Ser/Thr protein kinase)
VGEPTPQAHPVLRTMFDASGVGAVRRSVGSVLHEQGLDGQRADDFLIAVNEVMTNAVRHGGGTGELRLWSDDILVCEVRDEGGGFDAEAYTSRTERPPASATGGLGLWVASRMADAMSVTSGPAGTTVRIRTVLGDSDR